MHLVEHAYDPPNGGHDTKTYGHGEGVDKSEEIQEVLKSNKVKIEVT